MKISFTCLLSLSILVLAGCASTEYSMKSTEAPAYWDQGTGYNSRTYNGITYSVGPAEAIYEGAQFAVKIENNGNKSMTVDSSAFSLISASGSNTITAEDPEKMLDALNTEIADERTHNDPLGVNFVGTVMDTGDNSEEAKARRQKRMEEDKEAESKIHELTTQRDRIATRYLRKTTLRPGESAKGLVLFKNYSKWKRPNEVFLFRIAGIKEASNTVPFTVIEN